MYTGNAKGEEEEEEKKRGKKERKKIIGGKNETECDARR